MKYLDKFSLLSTKFRLIKGGFIAALALLIASCSHPLEIVGQGDIESSSGANDCLLGDQPCENLVAGNYNVTYSGIPHSGWEFVAWEGCAGQFPECTFDVPGSIVYQFWGQSAPALRAIFAPIDGTVVADGKLWLQPDLFRFLSWNQIAAVCPGGACTSGTLNGIDMTGWTWASTSDIKSLFNQYLDGEPFVEDQDFVFAPAIQRMYDDGWRALSPLSPPGIPGLTSTERFDGFYGSAAVVFDVGNSDNDQWNVGLTVGKAQTINWGAWFFRAPQ